MLIRSDSAGATYACAAARPTPRARFFLGAVIDAPIRDWVEALNTADGWYPAIDSSGATREGPWVAEAPNWWICRNGRPAPANPIRCWPNGCFTRKGRCRMLTPKTMRRPNAVAANNIQRISGNRHSTTL